MQDERASPTIVLYRWPSDGSRANGLVEFVTIEAAEQGISLNRFITSKIVVGV
jgi:hypothetical protein